MAREAILRVRMTTKELADAEARSTELGFENVSQFVRAMIRVAPVSPTGTTVSAAGAQVRYTQPPRDIDPAECPKKVGHRKGVYCKHCGATP